MLGNENHKFTNLYEVIVKIFIQVKLAIIFDI